MISSSFVRPNWEGEEGKELEGQRSVESDCEGVEGGRTTNESVGKGKFAVLVLLGYSEERHELHVDDVIVDQQRKLRGTEGET